MKNLTKSLVLIALMTIGFSKSMSAQQASTEQIEKLLSVMEAEKQFMVGMEAMMEMQKESGQAAMLPEGFFDEFIKEARSGYKTDLLPKLIEIHKINLTSDEANKLIAFYNTEVGKLMLNKMPTIQTESANAGMVWGQQLGMEVAQKLMSKE